MTALHLLLDPEGVALTAPKRIQRRRTKGWSLARAADPFRDGEQPLHPAPARGEA